MLYHCHNEVLFDTSYWWIKIPLLHSSLPNHTAVDLFVQQVKSEFRLWIIALFFVVCRHLSLYRMSFVHMIYLSLTPSQLLMVLIIRSVGPISESSYLSKKTRKMFIKKTSFAVRCYESNILYLCVHGIITEYSCFFNLVNSNFHQFLIFCIFFNFIITKSSRIWV